MADHGALNMKGPFITSSPEGNEQRAVCFMGVSRASLLKMTPMCWSYPVISTEIPYGRGWGSVQKRSSSRPGSSLAGLVNMTLYWSSNPSKH